MRKKCFKTPCPSVLTHRNRIMCRYAYALKRCLRRQPLFVSIAKIISAMDFKGIANSKFEVIFVYAVSQMRAILPLDMRDIYLFGVTLSFKRYQKSWCLTVFWCKKTHWFIFFKKITFKIVLHMSQYLCKRQV